MSTETIGEIVIAPRVLEVITGIAALKVEGIHSLHNKSYADGLTKNTLNRGVYLETNEEGHLVADIYVYLEYGVSVPSVAMEVQAAVKSAIHDMAELTVETVNVHVVGVVTEKTPKPDLTALFDEDFLND